MSASPDGKRLALQSFGLTGRGELWVYDMASRVTTKLQDNVLQSVRWTPDGGRLAFMRNEPTGFAPYWMPANGGGPAERIPNTAGVRFWSNFNFSPDGKNLIAPGRVGQATTARDVFAVPLDGKSPPLRLFQTDRIFGAPVASPDGKWLAYTTAERGSPEVYVRPFAANGSAVQISAGGGQSAQWTADGRRLIYIHNGSFWTTTLDVAGAVPRVVRTDSLRPQVYRNYDHLPDGRLAVISDDGRGPKLVVVTNWWQEVKTKFGIPR